MEQSEIMRQRHSVRQYTDATIETNKREVLDTLVAQINQKADLNIQILYDEPKCFDSILAHYGKFSGVRNYIALAGKRSPKLEEQLGYYGEQLVLKAQELGLSTCWVAMTHGKSLARIQKGEKLVCLISLGYGSVGGIAHKSKAVQEVSHASDPMPQWFREGIEAALLAPTAMNQQKFYFSLLPDGSVQATCGKGFYTKLDLGIVCYHFETVTARKVVT